MNRAQALIESIASALVEANLTGVSDSEKHNMLSEEAEGQSKLSTDKAKKALDTYTNRGYTYINSTLRGINSTHPSHGKKPTLEKINHLKTITQNTTDHSFKVFRGLRKNIHGPLSEGDLIHDRGFTSASINPGVAQHGFSKGAGERFIIHVTPGTKGFYAGHDSKLENSHEQEFILHPGTKFRVGKKETDKNGKNWINLHIHSQED